MTASWPEAQREGWLETAATLQMWSQIVGKVRLALAPRENHWWHIALYVTARGLTTSAIPNGNDTFQIDFDFIDHVLIIATSDGRREIMPLVSRPLAEFYAEFMARLAALGIDAKIWPVPVEVVVASPSPRITVIQSTGPRSHSASGASCRLPTWRLNGFAAASSESRARRISSGAASTWR